MSEKSSFLSKLKQLDANRLQKSMKAIVQDNGMLVFAMDAVREMQLSEEKSIIILAAEDGDLGAVISEKGDPEAFVLKKCGACFGVLLKNYLHESGIDYLSQHIVYDITELEETYKGKTLYKFEKRVRRKGEWECSVDGKLYAGDEVTWDSELPECPDHPGIYLTHTGS